MLDSFAMRPTIRPPPRPFPCPLALRAVVFDWYHVDADTRREALNSELDASLTIQNEDVYISEMVQVGARSRTCTRTC